MLASVTATAHAQQPNIALYYGGNVPWDELAAFDAAVVEPDAAGPLPANWRDGRTLPVAYLSLGEVHPTRPYFKDIPAAWHLGANTAWGSVVIDQTQADWPRWLIERSVKPLWEAGYRGFFLDTLDSYQLVAKTPQARAAQEAGLARIITEIKRAYPQAKLIFNRGFEILPQVYRQAWVVAFESLYRGWDQSEKRYREVPAADREWLTGQLKRVTDEYKLPVLAIDYVAPEERALARETATRIKAAGFIPWVSNPELDMLGVGAIEVMPRKLLMLYENEEDEFGLIADPIQQYASMPLNYMGYTTEYVEVSKGVLPAYPLAGRYAAVVAWFNSYEVGRDAELAALLRRSKAQGLRLAILGNFGIGDAQLLKDTLGLERADAKAAARVSIASKDAMMGFEIQPLPDRRTFQPLTSTGGTTLLQLTNETGQRMDAAALMPWGGYALSPYGIMDLPGGKGSRWVIDPFEFLRRALALPLMPAPDTTTESGRRLMITHIDGDGFASRAEVPGSPFSGEVLIRDFLEQYRLPTTVSVIQGEIAANGLYPKDSPALEALARRIFALPSVEVASHSYSHPFRWRKLERGNETGSYSLSIPGYSFDIAREVNGSIDYINASLVPEGKRTAVFLWTGDCNPGDDQVEQTYAAGILNMNGGDTWITRAEPSLTLVAPLGIPRGKRYQVFAPMQNENLYTNLWSGPFYGFERVIETFEMTETPRRLKPINIYYHMYSATKRASINALHKVYRSAIAQQPYNIYASEYIRKVLDFNRMTVAKSDAGWVVRGGGELRTLRLPVAAGYPDLATSRGLAGYSRATQNQGKEGDQQYLHLSGGEALIALSTQAPRQPYLAEANARVERFERDAAGFSLRLAGHLPLSFTLGAASGCEVRADGRVITPKAANRYELPGGTATITARCR